LRAHSVPYKVMARPILTIFLLAVFVLFVGCSSSRHRHSLPPEKTAPERHTLPPDYSTLEGVRFIYLGDLGNEEGADLIREKMRVRLLNSGRFEIVENPERADAVLTGSAGVEKRLHDGTTSYHGEGLLRLIDTKTQKTIWAHEYQRGFMFGGSVSTRVADQMTDQLLKDAGATK